VDPTVEDVNPQQGGSSRAVVHALPAVTHVVIVRSVHLTISSGGEAMTVVHSWSVVATTREAALIELSLLTDQQLHTCYKTAGCHRWFCWTRCRANVGSIVQVGGGGC